MQLVWTDQRYQHIPDPLDRVVQAVRDLAPQTTGPMMLMTTDAALVEGARSRALARSLWDILQKSRALVAVVPADIAKGIPRTALFDSPVYIVGCPRRRSPARCCGSLQEVMDGVRAGYKA